MKKYIYPLLSALAGAIIFGLGGLLKFAGYGANNCDVPGKNCDCFCCHSFASRGYEACGQYGLALGALIGIIVGLIIYALLRKNNK